MQRKSNHTPPNPYKIGMILIAFQELLNFNSVDFTVQYKKEGKEHVTLQKYLCESVSQINDSKGNVLDKAEIEEIVDFYLSEKMQE